ncbi:hypothetical protein [Lactovum miscens]|uniref:Uncharacterized protein n=1 Tax=Lactovum miscens TaxID=190387 RepID=A0A841CA63_9LACT|nr:hypothetical protein [Lactovum miscens]MBB5888472.1 hypothetical protein [Lactovum miscens]
MIRTISDTYTDPTKQFVGFDVPLSLANSNVVLETTSDVTEQLKLQIPFLRVG